MVLSTVAWLLPAAKLLLLLVLTSAATHTIVMVHVWACFKGKGVGLLPWVMLLRVLPLLLQLLLRLLLQRQPQ